MYQETGTIMAPSVVEVIPPFYKTIESQPGSDEWQQRFVILRFRGGSGILLRGAEWLVLVREF